LDIAVAQLKIAAGDNGKPKEREGDEKLFLDKYLRLLYRQRALDASMPGG